MAVMNLADPELELIDPTPNIHTLFIQFDKVFFWTKLSSRAVVRWSKRMYSCAGTCSYEGRGGLCDIALSEPLLKLRPRKDLVETLLHEMIHAFLFVTNRDQDRDGHGPNFRSHMHRINKSAGLNISIYHDFHDEVKLYLTHWWRCNGPCQKMKPYFGIVRRSNNRAPGPTDHWWKDHKRKCGGDFVKIKAPPEKVIGSRSTKNTKRSKTNTNIQGDILKYIKNKKVNVDDPVHVLDSINNNSGVNNINTLKNKSPSKPVRVFTGNGHIINKNRTGSDLSDFRSVTEHIRSVWANKQIPTKVPVNTTVNNTSASNPNKHKTNGNIPSPPAKVKRIDDYFKANATLKDLYGNEYKLPKPHFSKVRESVVNVNEEQMIECPVCNTKIYHKNVNRHLDECLNKDIIEKLTQNSKNSSQNNINNNKNSKIYNHIPPNNDAIDLTINANSLIDFTKSTSHDIERRFKKSNVILQTDAKPIDIINNNQNSERIETDSQLRNTNKQVMNKDENLSVTKRLHSTNILELSETNTHQTDRFITKDRRDNVIEVEYTEAQIKSRLNKTRSNIAEIITESDTNQLPGTSVEGKPGTSQSSITPKSRMSIDDEIEVQTCPCCGKTFDKTVEDHLDECLAFIIDDIKKEEASTSHGTNDVVVIDDDVDEFDETLTLNSTGTKTPCPCCMIMIEENVMEQHLDFCLGKCFE